MNRTRALEEERNAILFRIHESRDEYKKLLGEDRPARRPAKRAQIIDVPGRDIAPAPEASFAIQNPAVRWIKEHPVVCVAIVAGVVALGPRRVLRTGIKSVAGMAALTRRNTQNVDMVNRVIATVADYLQHRRPR